MVTVHAGSAEGYSITSVTSLTFASKSLGSFCRSAPSLAAADAVQGSSSPSLANSEERVGPDSAVSCTDPSPSHGETDFSVPVLSRNPTCDGKTEISRSKRLSEFICGDEEEQPAIEVCRESSSSLFLEMVAEGTEGDDCAILWPFFVTSDEMAGLNDCKTFHFKLRDGKQIKDRRLQIGSGEVVMRFSAGRLL